MYRRQRRREQTLFSTRFSTTGRTLSYILPFAYLLPIITIIIVHICIIITTRVMEKQALSQQPKRESDLRNIEMTCTTDFRTSVEVVSARPLLADANTNIRPNTKCPTDSKAPQNQLLHTRLDGQPETSAPLCPQSRNLIAKVRTLTYRTSVLMRKSQLIKATSACAHS